jgi:hypothetical protein
MKKILIGAILFILCINLNLEILSQYVLDDIDSLFFEKFINEISSISQMNQKSEEELDKIDTIYQFIDMTKVKDQIIYHEMNFSINIIKKKYEITWALLDEEGGGSVGPISQGYFELNDNNLMLKDKNNSFIMNCLITTDSIIFISGIKFLLDKTFMKLPNGSNWMWLEKFLDWDTDYGDNKKLFKENSIYHIKSGKYCDNGKNFFIELKDSNYDIYLKDIYKIKYEISKGTFNIRGNKIFFKDEDNINIIEAYINGDTIQPINHLPFNYDNPPLILIKE